MFVFSPLSLKASRIATVRRGWCSIGRVGPEPVPRATGKTRITGKTAGIPDSERVDRGGVNGQRTQYSEAGEARTRHPLISSRALYHSATALQYHRLMPYDNGYDTI